MALSPSTVKKANEWVSWFNWHSDKIGSQPTETQVRWLLRAVGGAYELITLMGNEMNSNFRASRDSSFRLTEGGIVVPKSWNLDGKR